MKKITIVLTNKTIINIKRDLFNLRKIWETQPCGIDEFISILLDSIDKGNIHPILIYDKKSGDPEIQDIEKIQRGENNEIDPKKFN